LQDTQVHLNNDEKEVSMSTTNGSITADSYAPLVQQLYISYFGRPADPAGLKNFSEQLFAMKAPQDLGGVLTTMKTDVGLKTLVNSFGTSEESTTLYGNDVMDFTIAIYINVLNRLPDYEGLMFWSGEIKAGRLTQAAAAVSIAEGAMARAGDDAKLLLNKEIISTNFTKSLDTPTELLAYVGNSAAVVARSILLSVTAHTDPATFDLSQFLTGAPTIPIFDLPGDELAMGAVDGIEVSLIGNTGLPAFDAAPLPFLV
jgi:hypothetical protein